MIYPIYVVEVVDISGKTIALIDDAISIQAARAFNTEGSATVVIPSSWYDRNIFRMHTRLRIIRYGYRGVPGIFGDTIWFLKKLDHGFTDQTFTLTLVDAFTMLNTRIVAYTSQTPYADKTLEELALITYNNSLRVDNMMLAYIRENFGDLALDEARWNTHIDIDRDKNKGPYGEKQAAWQELGSVLSDLASQSEAKGMPIYYDLIPLDEGRFAFKIWDKVRGVDRGSFAPGDARLILNDKDGMLDDIHEVEDYTDVATVCYALGYDSGPSQMIEEVQSPLLVRNDPFGRIEMTTNESDSDVPSVLVAAAQAALNGKRPKRRVMARVVENSSLRYDDHFSYGDVLIVEIAGQKYDVAVNAVSVQWDENGEDLDIRLSGEEAIGLFIPGGPITPGVGIPGVNTAPVVDAGDDATSEALSFDLVGSAVDDGLPDPPGELTYLWSKISGPGTVAFVDDTSPETLATFSESGVYVLRLVASDGDLSDEDEVTITVPEGDVIIPPDIGLVTGQTDVVGISEDGFAYRTNNFTDVTPVWDEVDLSVPGAYSWIVDPFSPGYLNGDGTGSIDGWVVNETDIYRLEDLFGTPISTSVHTFATATDSSAFHWRTIQASFGAFFAEGDNPWLLCISYYGSTAGHQGTWATYSIDGGATWATEVQIESVYNPDPTPLSFDPVAVYTSPRTPGYGVTVSRSGESDPNAPIWGFEDNGVSVTPPVIIKHGGVLHYAVTAVQGPDVPGNISTNNPTLQLAPPADAVRVEVTVDWYAERTQVDPGFGSAGTTIDHDIDPSVAHDNTNDFNWTNPGAPPGGAGTTSSFGTYSMTITRDAAHNTEWEGNRDDMIAGVTASSIFAGWSFLSQASAIGDASAITRHVMTFTVTEIELEDSTIYTPDPGENTAIVTNDWGATWAVVNGMITAGEGMAGTLHFPWPTNPDEDIIYYGRMETTTVREFRLHKSTAGTITDISPTSGAVTFGVTRGPFGCRSHDTTRQYMLLAGTGNETSVDPADDVHAVFISDDEGATWTEIVAPVASQGDGRGGFEAAFSGSTETELYVWGPAGYFSFSDDSGSIMQNKSGNLAALGASRMIGIAGGAVPP